MATNTFRNADSSVTLIIHRQPENIPLPYELQGNITPEKWDYRIMQINKLCAQYSKPLLERIWFVLSFLTVTIVPTVLNHVIFDAITPKALRDAFDRDIGNSDGPPSNRFDGTSEDQIVDKIIETRWITFGIFLGLFVVMWTPLFVWKYIGVMRARAMTTRWAVEDGQSGASFIPRWRIQPPGVFTINGSVTITTPPGVMPTLFNPQAYLPPYILQAGQQAAGVMWAQSQPQQVPYNPAGPQTGIPPNYYRTDAGAPGENASRDNEKENPFGDEKRAQEYEDVKV